MFSDYLDFSELTLADQLRLAALEGEWLLPAEMLDAIQQRLMA